MADADGVRVRVLHVDDDPEIIDLAATFLRREDDRLEVDAAETADTALERAREGTVDCIVSDYHLPDMDCDEFAATIADIDPDIPFVLFTGRDRTQIDATYLEEGITAYLQKGSGTEKYSRLAREILAAAGGNGGDEDLLVLAVGAPRDSEDVRLPAACPDCGHDDLRLEGDGGVVFVCPDCAAEHVPADCPECGGEGMGMTLGEDGKPVAACRDCGATFPEPPLTE